MASEEKKEWPISMINETSNCNMTSNYAVHPGSPVGRTYGLQKKFIILERDQIQLKGILMHAWSDEVHFINRTVLAWSHGRNAGLCFLTFVSFIIEMRKKSVSWEAYFCLVFRPLCLPLRITSIANMLLRWPICYQPTEQHQPTPLKNFTFSFSIKMLSVLPSSLVS